MKHDENFKHNSYSLYISISSFALDKVISSIPRYYNLTAMLDLQINNRKNEKFTIFMCTLKMNKMKQVYKDHKIENRTYSNTYFVFFLHSSIFFHNKSDILLINKVFTGNRFVYL